MSQEKNRSHYRAAYKEGWKLETEFLFSTIIRITGHTVQIIDAEFIGEVDIYYLVSTSCLYIADDYLFEPQ